MICLFEMKILNSERERRGLVFSLQSKIMTCNFLNCFFFGGEGGWGGGRLKITKAKARIEGATWELESGVMRRKRSSVGRKQSSVSGSFPFYFHPILTHDGSRMQFGGYLGYFTCASRFLMPFEEGSSVIG